MPSGIGDAAGAGGPFAVLVKEDVPEAALEAALFAHGAGEGLGVGFEVEVVFGVFHLHPRFLEHFRLRAERVFPEGGAKPHVCGDKYRHLIYAADAAGIVGDVKCRGDFLTFDKLEPMYGAVFLGIKLRVGTALPFKIASFINPGKSKTSGVTDGRNESAKFTHPQTRR